MSGRWLWLIISCGVAGTGGACGARSNGDNCNCPTGNNTAVLELQCTQPVPPDVQVVGACTVQSSPLNIFITSTGPGTCQVAVTFSNGTAYSMSVTVSDTWFACGSDPHGCGQQLIVSPASVSVGNECMDAGNDAAEFSD